MQDTMASYMKQMERSMADLQEMLENKYSTIGHTDRTWTVQEKKEAYTQFQELADRMEQFRLAAIRDYNSKQNIWYDLLREKACAAVEAVSNDRRYSYILDTSRPNYLDTDPGEDITELVRKKWLELPSVLPPLR